jgi:hypothetical protein
MEDEEFRLPTRDEPIVFVKSRSMLTKDHLPALALHFDKECGWFYHSEYNEGANSSWWHATYTYFRGVSPPKCLDHLLPMISLDPDCGDKRDDPKERNHRESVRNMFACRRYNVIACRSVGQAQGMYPSIQYLNLNKERLESLIHYDGIRQLNISNEDDENPGLSHFFVVNFPFYLEDIMEIMKAPDVICNIIHDYQNIDTVTCYVDEINIRRGDKVLKALSNASM